MVDVNFDTLTNDDFMELFSKMLLEKKKREKQIIQQKKEEVDALLNKAFKIIEEYDIKVEVSFTDDCGNYGVLDADYGFYIN